MAARKKEIEKIEVAGEEEVVSEEMKARENTTLIWVLVIVGIVFASILIPYFWIESTKTFEYGRINWTVEDYDNLKIFHGRFVSLTNPNLNYNIFLRVDPRKNDVDVSGTLDDFKYGGIISLATETDECRGDLARSLLDLSAFLRQGIGVGPVESAFINEEWANETGKKFVTCENTKDRTVVVVDIGEERGIVKSDVNPYCYVITAETCEDSAVVEKFMVSAVADFGEKLRASLGD